MPWKEERNLARFSSFQSQEEKGLVPQNGPPTKQPAEMAPRERRVHYGMFGRARGYEYHQPVP